MSFNPDPNKEAETIKKKKNKANREDHLPLAFNNNNMLEANSQRHSSP